MLKDVWASAGSSAAGVSQRLPGPAGSRLRHHRSRTGGPTRQSCRGQPGVAGGRSTPDDAGLQWGAGGPEEAAGRPRAQSADSTARGAGGPLVWPQQRHHGSWQTVWVGCCRLKSIMDIA
eukprot:scaffold204392_cov27-Prasinocladus_malaysianus.AAC.1